MYKGSRQDRTNWQVVSKLGKPFTKVRKKTTYLFSCDNCSEEFERPRGSVSPDRLNNSVKHFCEKCSRQCSGEVGRKNRYVKTIGHRSLDASGYVTVYVGKGYCYSKPYGGRLREHILLMEKSIGRALNTSKGKRISGNAEVVHHIDGDKTNNELSNLDLCTVQQHNKCHATIEKIVFELYKKGLVGYNKVKKEYFLK